MRKAAETALYLIIGGACCNYVLLERINMREKTVRICINLVRKLDKKEGG